jgi:hypothetical protein
MDNMDLQQMTNMMNTGPTTGTSLSTLNDISQNNQQNNQQLAMQQMLLQKQHEQQQQILFQQRQQQQLIEEMQRKNAMVVNPKISTLISDINNSLDDKTKTEEDHNEINEDDETEEIIVEKPSKTRWFSAIPYSIKEVTLLVSLYYILSIGFIKKMIGSYIKQINPMADGNISFLGIIIYGIILAVIFVLSKKLIIKN